jgi:ketosteroid isomerase-like protein
MQGAPPDSRPFIARPRSPTASRKYDAAQFLRDTGRAMSRQNVEFVEALFAGAAGADKQTLLAALPEIIAESCDLEIEWVEDPSRADGQVHRGHEGVRASFEEWLAGFEDYQFELEEVLDGGEHVLAVGTEHGRGAASGAAVSSRNHMVLTFRDGKLLRYREFYDERAARQAAGLKE